jgi:hypothetical protein
MSSPSQPTDFSVVAVGNTELAKFPLILIIGRESNGSARIVPGISIYDETVSTRSAFWNRAYGFVQRAVLWAGPLRQSCVRMGVSPMIFSNALPKPIPNSIQDKDAYRIAVEECDIRAHIQGVFNLTIANRIRMVIFSTGNKQIFSFPRAEVLAACRAKGIPFLEVPYFGTQGLSNAILDEAMDAESLRTLKAIMTQFHADTQQGGFAAL